jgi:hypothetical protein
MDIQVKIKVHLGSGIIFKDMEQGYYHQWFCQVCGVIQTIHITFIVIYGANSLKIQKQIHLQSMSP